MASSKQRKEVPAPPALLADFQPKSFLWEAVPPVFPSEQSAHWALRQYRAALVEARALAILRGRMLVHPQRVAAVIERLAIEAASRLRGGAQ